MIESIARFKELIPTVAGQNMGKYMQPIQDARTWLIRNITGRPLLEIIEALDADDPLYLVTELVVACKAYLIAIPKMDVIETSNGFGVIRDDATLPASRDRVAALQTSTAESLSAALETLIEYLEDTPDYRAEWIESPAYDAMSGTYFDNFRTFKKLLRFAGSYLEYIAATPALQGIIVKYIEPRISPELSREIIDQVRTGAVSGSNGKILDDLRLAVAGFFNNDTLLGDSLLCRVRELLEERPDDFPVFKNSRLYARLTARREASANTSIHVMI